MQYLLESIIAIVVFFSILFLLPKNLDETKIAVDTQTWNIQFILHGSADEWEDFFVEQWLDELLSQDESDILLNMLVEDENIAWKWDSTNNQDNDDDKIIKWNKSCLLPWHGKSIEDWEDVLAYKQRDDVLSLCHVERRVCHDGVLWWSFTQVSCSENISYAYTKWEVILYNPQIENPYIQTDNRAKHYDAEFNTQWQRNNNLIPIDVWNNNINDSKTTETSTVPQSKTIYKNCTTPRWENVIHSQFVKAYKEPIWFNNKVCEVELRFCIDGRLWWTYENRICEHKDMVWQDYDYKSEHDERPTILNLIDSLK